MDTGQSLDGESPELIREQIEETRASLGQKLETLENEVRSTVHEASESVKETVDNVKRAFDIRHQVETRPWVSVGLAFAAGAALGAMTMKARAPARRGTRHMTAGGRSSAGSMKTRLQPELQAVRAMAVGAGMSFLGELLKEAIPVNLRARMGGVVSRVSEKLGGEPTEGRTATEERPERFVM